jgi:hypothetical protein
MLGSVLVAARIGAVDFGQVGKSITGITEELGRYRVGLDKALIGVHHLYRHHSIVQRYRYWHVDYQGGGSFFRRCERTVINRPRGGATKKLTTEPLVKPVPVI